MLHSEYMAAANGAIGYVKASVSYRGGVRRGILRLFGYLARRKRK